MHELICYTDGAQSCGSAGIGLVFVLENSIINTSIRILKELQIIKQNF